MVEECSVAQEALAWGHILVRRCHGRHRPGSWLGLLTAIVPAGPAFVYPSHAKRLGNKSAEDTVRKGRPVDKAGLNGRLACRQRATCRMVIRLIEVAFSSVSCAGHGCSHIYGSRCSPIPRDPTR